MKVTDKAKNYHKKMFPKKEFSFTQTDPEFFERFLNFAYDDALDQNELDDKTRFTAILATLIGCQGIDHYRIMVPAAMNFGVTPVEVKEIVYQAVAYLGMGRVYPFLLATNEVFTELGIPLPLEKQATTTKANRLEKGEEVQVAAFGETMRGFAFSGNEDVQHINRWLVENCFGDYYTRKGLNLRQREIITFCFLAAQSGCEPQLISHAKTNIRIGNSKTLLIKIVSSCLPYIGYPRTLNVLRCIEEAMRP